MEGGREGAWRQVQREAGGKALGVSPNPSLFTFLLGPNSLCSRN